MARGAPGILKACGFGAMLRHPDKVNQAVSLVPGTLVDKGSQT
jgi:hypothetical protein